MTQLSKAFFHIKQFPSVFWVIIAATFMNQLGNMGIVFIVLYLNQHLKFSLMQASAAFIAFSISMLMTGLLSGGFIDQVGAARLMVGALFINSLILFIFPFAHHYPLIMFFCLLWGLTFGLYRPAAQTLLTHLSTPGLHKLTFSLYRLALNLGMSVGPALGGYIAAHSYPAIFTVNGIANFVASIVLLIGLKWFSWLHYRPTLTTKPELSFIWLKRDRTLLLFMLAMVPVGMIFFQHEVTLPVFLNRDLHFPLSFYGLLFTINTLIIVFFELLLNIATMHWSYRINFILGSVFITAGFAGLYFATTAWHIIALTVVWTIGEMVLYPSSSSYIADLAPVAHRGSYMSILSTCSNLSMLLGPWAGGIVMQHFGARSLWLICAFWGLISVIIFNYCPEPRQPHQQS